MSDLSAMLNEALCPVSDFVRFGSGVAPVTEEAADEWMQEAIRQFRTVAPQHAAWLKKKTGRSWKLFKHPLQENGQLIFRFDLARRQDIVNDPMIVVRLAYSKSADLYNVQVEAWRAVGQMIGHYETSGVDTEMFQDPQRFYWGVDKALLQLYPGDRTEGKDMTDLSSELSEALLLEKSMEGDSFDPSRFQKRNAASKKLGDVEDRKHTVAKPAGGDKKPSLLKRGMKMVFGKWVKTEGEEIDGVEVFDLDESLIGKSVDGATGAPKTESVGWEALEEGGSPLSAEGGTFGSDRTNPTKSGPAAERATVLKQAKAGIDRMIAALETVRGWTKGLNLGDKDKSGAAAAALKIAASEIAKVEDAQRIVSTIFELDAMDPGSAFKAMNEAVALIEAGEKSKAKEGLARMIDGIRQLHGMLRQAKLSGRILDQLEAAINGLKATRDALEALKESALMAVPGPIPSSYEYPPGTVNFERMKAADIRKGFWVKGGDMYSPIYREVVRVERHEEDMANVILTFGTPYVNSEGEKLSTARFHKDAVVTATKPGEPFSAPQKIG